MHDCTSGNVSNFARRIGYSRKGKWEIGQAAKLSFQRANTRAPVTAAIRIKKGTRCDLQLDNSTNKVSKYNSQLPYIVEFETKFGVGTNAEREVCFNEEPKDLPHVMTTSISVSNVILKDQFRPV